MNFEDHSDRRFRKFTSGTSKRRFIAGLTALVLVIIAFFIQQHNKTSEKDPADLVILLWVPTRNINVEW